jgi:hypothetical protein
MLVTSVTYSLLRAASLFAEPAAFVRTAAVTRPVSGSMMTWLLNPAVVAGMVGDPAHRGPCHLADIYVTGSVVADEHFIALIPPIENEPPATCLGHVHDGWPRTVWKLLRDGLSGRLLGRDNMQRSSASLGDP